MHAALLSLFALTAAAEPTVATLAIIGDDGATEAALRAQLSHLGAELQPTERTRAEVASAADLGVVCEWTDAVCLSRLAIVLRVPTLITGLRVGTELQLAAVQGQRMVRATAVLPEGRGRALNLRVAARQLLGLPPAGLLSVDAEDGLQISVDGRVEGISPTGLLALSPGPHTVVAVTAAGELVAEGAVEIESKQTTELTLRANASASSGLSAWPPTALTAAAGGAVFAAGLTGAMILEATVSLTSAGTFEDRLAMQTTERVLLAVAGIGLVTGALGGGLYAVEAMAE